MRTRDMLRLAKKLGREAGENAAAWVAQDTVGGRVTRGAKETAQRILKGIDDGDPEVLDAFRLPNLSGEYADDPTPETLAEDCELDMERDGADDTLSTLCDAWENACNDAFWTGLANFARAALADSQAEEE